MATLPNLVFVSVTIETPPAVVTVPNAVARTRQPRPTPFNAAPTAAPE